MSLVLAFSRRPDASLRDIVRTGAIDLLQLPVEDKELAEAVERGIELASRGHRAGGRHGRGRRPPAAAAAAPGGPGTVFTISSATGGCGKTFYATNLAYFLTRYTEKRVCIVDLDLQFGEVSTALRLRPKFTIFDALQREDTDEARPRRPTSRSTRSPRDRRARAGRAPRAVRGRPHQPAGRHPDPRGRPQAVRLRHRRHAAGAGRDRPGRLRHLRHALRDGHARPAERAEHERVPQHPRPPEGARPTTSGSSSTRPRPTSASTSTRSRSCSRRASSRSSPTPRR